MDRGASAAHARIHRWPATRSKKLNYSRQLDVAELREWRERLDALDKPAPPVPQHITEFRALLDLRSDPHCFDHQHLKEDRR